MSNDTINHYKRCREHSTFSQEQAAALLHVSVRTLSDYENDNTKVPDCTVDKMCEIYTTPYLAIWHLKTKSPLGKFLPDLVEPTTVGDMMFSLSLAMDDATQAYETMKPILRDKTIEDIEVPIFLDAVEKAKAANANLTSIILYAEKLLRDCYKD